MRTCFILSTRGLAYGGLETIADQLAVGLVARGHAVSFLAGFAPGRSRRRDLPAGIESAFIPLLPHTFFPLRVLSRLFRQQALNLQSLSFFLAALASTRARRGLAQCEVAVTFLEGDAVLFSRYLARSKTASVYYFSGGIDPQWAWRDHSTLRVAISQTVAARVWRDHQYRTDGVVTPGIALELIAAPLPQHARSTPFRLIYVGRLYGQQKRVAFLLPILQALAPEFPGLTLRLVGDGPSRPALEREVRARGLEGQVIFCGALPHAQVVAELRRADVFLFPSAYESFGVAPLEAMAVGVPVIASDLPALREATGAFATLLPGDDLVLWVKATRQLLSNASLRLARARACRAWAAQFTWEHSAARLEEYIMEAHQKSHNR